MMVKFCAGTRVAGRLALRLYSVGLLIPKKLLLWPQQAVAYFYLVLLTSNFHVLLFLTRESTAVVWDIQHGGAKQQDFVGHQYPIWGITVLDDGTVVTGT
jgi:hypothetical protein